MLAAFGARVEMLRQQLGVSKAELARRVCVHSTYIGKIENGTLRVAPSVAVITRLEKVLGVRPGELRELAGSGS
jgi:transcriptional regulator with XRE-family HTH domain